MRIFVLFAMKSQILVDYIYEVYENKYFFIFFLFSLTIINTKIFLVNNISLFVSHKNYFGSGSVSIKNFGVPFKTSRHHCSGIASQILTDALRSSILLIFLNISWPEAPTTSEANIQCNFLTLIWVHYKKMTILLIF
ncbi:UNVERIFIED_CONTAM: hypothetical protein RMT77_002691 [Armadillidium vulgare]